MTRFTAINAVLAALVTTVGAWLVWGPFSIGWSLAVGSSIFLFLLWRSATIGTVWAWATLLLGMESFAWPVTTMVGFRSSANQPSEEEMGVILNAVLFGLFSSVFWVSFAVGLFRREQRAELQSSQEEKPAFSATDAPSRRRKRRS
ncbi:MAG TPA: hypothetical protein VHF07_05610 [Nitrospiraceae bacterium]|nr:hypothetical protein [Nitrospiraceae bacterium]